MKYNSILSLKNTYMQYTLRNAEDDHDSSSVMRNNTPRVKKADYGGMDIEQGASKPSEGSEPRLHKKVKKEFSDISSIDEERKSECSRLSIEQRLAEIKMEDDSPSNYSQDYSDIKSRAYTYSHESLVEELKKKASNLVSIETDKTRSQTAEAFLGTPTSNLLSKIGNPMTSESYESTKSSIHSGMTLIGGPNVAKGNNSNTLSHYMNNSLGSLVSRRKTMDICQPEDQYMQANLRMIQQQNQQQLLQQQQQQQLQQLNSQCIKLTPVDVGKQQFMMNQIPQQFQFNTPDKNPQLIDNERNHYYTSLFQNKATQSQRSLKDLIPVNLSFLTGNRHETQQQYGSNYLPNVSSNRQLGGTPLLLNSNQNLISTATNPILGSVRERSDPTNHPIVQAALNNINANMMLISKIINESDNQNEFQKDRAHSLPQAIGYTTPIPTQQYSTMAPTLNNSQIIPPPNLYSNAQSFFPLNNSTSGSLDKERCLSNPFPLPTRKNGL